MERLVARGVVEEARAAAVRRYRIRLAVAYASGMPEQIRAILQRAIAAELREPAE